MVDEQVVRGIVETYDLPQRLSDKITRIAARNIGEYSISSFDSQYRYIAGLIERFTSHYQERFFRRIDPIKPDLAIEDRNLSGCYREERDARISVLDTLDILRGHLDESELWLLNQLYRRLGKIPYLLDSSPEELVRNVNQIHESLMDIAHKYESNGRLVIPRRPIVSVKLNPLFVKFGRRRYHGDPLKYFVENEKYYSEVSRSELHRIDSGLYLSLRKYGQLDEAIPTNNKRKMSNSYHLGRPLSTEEIEQIRDAFSNYNGNAVEAAKKLPFGHVTICRHWLKLHLRERYSSYGRRVT